MAYGKGRWGGEKKRWSTAWGLQGGALLESFFFSLYGSMNLKRIHILEDISLRVTITLVVISFEGYELKKNINLTLIDFHVLYFSQYMVIDGESRLTKLLRFEYCMHTVCNFMKQNLHYLLNINTY